MTSPRPIGLVVNPRSGNDVRRVIASAGSSTLEDKTSIVRRVVLGARLLGATSFITHHEPHQIVRRATETLRGITIEKVGEPIENTEHDTTRAVEIMRERGCAVVLVLGGDGTNRAAAKGWPDLPVLPLSTGTNNAFPYWVEPTVAGSAAGLLATGVVPSDDTALKQAKVVRIAMPDGGEELALIDAVAVADPWVGSLELFDPATMRTAVLTRADTPRPSASRRWGGLLVPCGAEEERAACSCGSAPSTTTRPPCCTRPPPRGTTRPSASAKRASLHLGAGVTVEGPVLLAFDGERKRRLQAGETAELRVVRDEAAGGRRAGRDGRGGARAGVFVGQSSVSAIFGKGGRLMGAEIVIKGGTVYDGTGAPGVVADVAISGGKIVEVGPGLSGDRVLDAGGHAVAPGFVDIHTHYDAQVFWDPALTPSCYHGVTTVVAGNCGFSIAPHAPRRPRAHRPHARKGRGHGRRGARRRHPVGLRDLPRVPSRRSSGAARC